MPRRAYGRPTLLEESVAESYPTRRGVKVSGLHSSAELTLVPWWIEQLAQFGRILLPQFLRENVHVEVLDNR